MTLTALLVLGVGGVVLLAADLVVEGNRPLLQGLAALLAAAACGLLWFGTGGVPALAGDALLGDRMARLLGALACAAAALTALLPLPVGDGADARRRSAGYLALLVWSAAGMVLLAAAGDLLTLFLGLELLSLALYALTGFRERAQGPGGEAALKYFLLGGLGSGLVLYGGALIFAADGRLDFLARAVPQPPALALVGLGLVMAGLAFKLALMPFHLWTPDVYEGAPVAVTAFMAVGTKAAAFGALAHLLWQGFPQAPQVWGPLLGAAAVLSLLLGYVLAAPQAGGKRLLAYSSIAHAGTAALALLLVPAGATVLPLYLYAYGAATFGAFACLAGLEAAGVGDGLAQLAGLLRRRPWLGGALVLFLLSLASVPLTGGFAGKLLLLLALVGGGRGLLAALVVASTVVALYPYFKLAYLTAVAAAGPAGAGAAPRLPAGVAATLCVCAAATLLLGLDPQLLTAVAP
jgi:NADH-quinone oxidoreductase subunit N